MITIREIIAITALNFGVETNAILAENRRKHVVLARQVAIYLARTLTTHSTVTIGDAFAGRDHTTVLYSVERIQTELDADPHGKLAALIKSIARNIELRDRIDMMGGIDVIAVARHIATDPVRAAMAASVMEISALAATVIDLWDIALAAEEAIQLRERQIAITNEIMTAELMAEDEDNAARLAGLERAIVDELAALRGGPNTAKQETYNGSRHS